VLPPQHERERDTTTTMAHIYENGTRAWQPDATDGWVASEVVDKQIEGDKVKLVFQLENGEVRTRWRGEEGRRRYWGDAG
jgi:myosin heavy subunit